MTSLPLRETTVTFILETSVEREREIGKIGRTLLIFWARFPLGIPRWAKLGTLYTGAGRMHYNNEVEDGWRLEVGELKASSRQVTVWWLEFANDDKPTCPKGPSLPRYTSENNRLDVPPFVWILQSDLPTRGRCRGGAIRGEIDTDISLLFLLCLESDCGGLC